MTKKITTSLSLALIAATSATAQNASFSNVTGSNGLWTMDVFVGGAQAGTATLTSTDDGAGWDPSFLSTDVASGNDLQFSFTGTNGPGPRDPNIPVPVASTISHTLSFNLNAGWSSDWILAGNRTDIDTGVKGGILGNGQDVQALGNATWNVGGNGTLIDNPTVAWSNDVGSSYSQGFQLSGYSDPTNPHPTNGGLLSSGPAANGDLDWSITSAAGASSYTWNQSYALNGDTFTTALESLRFDANLTQVPEPSSALLGALAGGLMLLRRKR